jgi:hypothetical protein
MDDIILLSNHAEARCENRYTISFMSSWFFQVTTRYVKVVCPRVLLLSSFHFSNLSSRGSRIVTFLPTLAVRSSSLSNYVLYFYLNATKSKLTFTWSLFVSKLSKSTEIDALCASATHALCSCLHSIAQWFQIVHFIFFFCFKITRLVLHWQNNFIHFHIL